MLNTLNKANKKIADLREDIHRLSDELKNKQALLTSVLNLAPEQSVRIASLTTTLQDTIPWNPSTCLQPSSWSTPYYPSSWAEVVVSDRNRVYNVSPPSLSLSNCFEALAGENMADGLGLYPAPGCSVDPSLLAAASGRRLPAMVTQHPGMLALPSLLMAASVPAAPCSSALPPGDGPGPSLSVAGGTRTEPLRGWFSVPPPEQRLLHCVLQPPLNIYVYLAGHRTLRLYH
ncbi:hypothetical protein D5F01_LYC22323 [Scomber scombrus]|uniref:Uncharacterized protein n=1 Tax=Scomber scombrus TaxID=13677 RepID=A0AAV1QDH5_SCOSC